MTGRGFSAPSINSDGCFYRVVPEKGALATVLTLDELAHRTLPGWKVQL